MKRHLYFHNQLACIVNCKEDLQTCPVRRLLFDDKIEYRLSYTTKIQRVYFYSLVHSSLRDDKDFDDMYCKIIKLTCQNCPKRKREK